MKGTVPLYDPFSADYDRFVNWEGRLAYELPFEESPHISPQSELSRGDKWLNIFTNYLYALHNLFTLPWYNMVKSWQKPTKP